MKICPCRSPKWRIDSCIADPQPTNEWYCLLEGDTFGKRCPQKMQEHCYHPETLD